MHIWRGPSADTSIRLEVGSIYTRLQYFGGQYYQIAKGEMKNEALRSEALALIKGKLTLS